jgi:hypothetical protein
MRVPNISLEELQAAIRKARRRENPQELPSSSSSQPEPEVPVSQE